MKTFIQLLISICASFSAVAQVYTHPPTTIAGEYVGACEVATCAGTYYDNGGVAGNYTNNIGGSYRIFCPNTAGQCLTATFSSFSIEGGGGCPYDYFVVTNGSTQNSPVLWAGCGTGSIGPFTGTNNGCLGFRFWSDFSVNMPGWAATFSCAPCPGAPTGTSNNDCNFATPVCANVTTPGNSTGPGIIAEACGGGGCPAGGENYSNWFMIQVQTGGTFTFTIVPQVTSDDYDYAVYGPNPTCGSLGASIRCSDSALTGNTGLNSTALDLAESVSGDKFTAQMNVLAGQIYYIMVDEWTPTGAGFNLNFGGTAVLGCSVLPVEYSSISANYSFQTRSVQLDWITKSEINNDYFAIERSLDGGAFETLAIVDGKGTSNEENSYRYIDQSPFPGEVNYYRIKQVNFNGEFEYSDIQAVIISDPTAQFNVYPNPAKNSATLEFINAIDQCKTTVSIYDFTGRLVEVIQFIAVKGSNKISLDLSNYPQGVYFMSLNRNDEIIKGSFVKED